MKSATRTEGRALGSTSTTDEPVARSTHSPDSDVRITVALIPKVAGGLTRLQQRTNLSKTDIANRAISSYEFFQEHLQAGRELIIRDKKTGETLLVRFL
jgi:predicted transcriptional regulator